MNIELIDEMKAEMSGFGGGYEKTCRSMLKAGLKWLEENPGADPKFQGYENIYGVITESNDDAKKLSKAVLDGSGGDCTGAMHQAVIETIFYIKKNGIDKYLEHMNSPAPEEKEG